MFGVAEQLISKGKYQKALLNLKELSEDLFSIVESLKCRILIAECTRSIGKYNRSLEFSQEIIDDCELHSDTEDNKLRSEILLLRIDAMIQKSHALLLLTKYDESLDIIQQITDLLHDKKALPQKAKLLRLEGWIKLWQGHTDEALECAQNAMDIGEKIGDQDIIAPTCQIFGAIYQVTCDFDLALRYCKRSLAIRENQGNITIAMDLHNNLGAIYSEAGELNLAIHHYEKALGKKESKTEVRGIIIGNIGFVYYLKGELEKALEYTNDALAINRKDNHLRGIASNLATTGRIFRELGDFNKAFNFLERSFELFSKLGMEINSFDVAFELLVTAVESHSRKKADQYLVKLCELEKKLDVPWKEGALDLAKALVLRIRNQSETIETTESLLHKVAYQENMLSRFRILALLNLCSLILGKLKESGNSKFLQEVRKHVAILSEIAQKQNSYWILAESFVLESKLALLGLDFRDASRLLTKAQKIAFEKGLGRLAIKISSEHDCLLDRESMWSKLEQESLLAERIELAKIDKQVNEMFHRGLIEDPDLLEEEPIMLIILDQGGLCFYSRKFASSTDISAHMIAGFLNAIQNFSSEFFSQALDRIRLESYTLLFRVDSSITYCYIFKGQSYEALQKMLNFIENLQQNASVLEPILECIINGVTISPDIRNSLDNLVEEVF